MLDRIFYRVQPITQILDRKRRQKELEKRHKELKKREPEFKKFVNNVEIKRLRKGNRDVSKQ
jgi:hypothetical protein